jgi:hypothetical protein
MAKSLSRQNNFTKILSSNTFKDLIIIVIINLLVLILSYYFNIFILLVELFQKNPRAVTYIDEIISGLVTLSVSLAVFSWRRWRELKIETAKRLKLQEELTNIADTKAEAERIIAKQLQIEIELRKQEERSQFPPRKKK